MSLFFHVPEASTSASPPAAPPALDSVVLLPLTRRSYTFAQSSPDRLVELLSSRPGAVVRTGDVLSLGSEWSDGKESQTGPDEGGAVRAWRVVMTEPVLAGVYVAPPAEQDGEDADDLESNSRSTQLMVAPWQSDSNDNGDPADEPELDHLARSTSSLSQRSDSSSASSQRTVKPILSPPPTPPPDIEDYLLDDPDDDVDAEDDFEITSSFLQSALLSSSTAALPPGPASGSNLSESIASLASSQDSDHSRLPPLGRVYQAGALTSRVGSSAADEAELTIWVRTRILGEVGCFDGDWVRLTPLIGHLKRTDY